MPVLRLQNLLKTYEQIWWKLWRDVNGHECALRLGYDTSLCPSILSPLYQLAHCPLLSDRPFLGLNCTHFHLGDRSWAVSGRWQGKVRAAALWKGTPPAGSSQRLSLSSGPPPPMAAFFTSPQASLWANTENSNRTDFNFKNLSPAPMTALITLSTREREL